MARSHDVVAMVAFASWVLAEAGGVGNMTTSLRGAANASSAKERAPESNASLSNATLEMRSQGSVSLFETLFSHGNYGNVDPGRDEFNARFRSEAHSIVRRECVDCEATHRDVYFRWKSGVEKFDAYEGLLGTWRGDVGFHTDFDIYSSLQDAVTFSNPWQFCNGNDPGIGFPRDCGPRGAVPWQWNSKSKNYHLSQKNYRYSVYRGQPQVELTLFSAGWYGDRDIGRNEFNAWVNSQKFPIVRRECSGCEITHRDVYFRWKLDNDFDAYDMLLGTWRGDVGFHTDVDIYSSLQDALTFSNPWQFCNGNDPGINFPRDCGPRGAVPWQWNSKSKKYHLSQKNYRYSLVIVRR